MINHYNPGDLVKFKHDMRMGPKGTVGMVVHSFRGYFETMVTYRVLVKENVFTIDEPFLEKLGE